MTRWLLGISALIIAAACTAVPPKISEGHRAEHQAALSEFTRAFKPGTTRKQVEDYLHAQNLKFGRICCNQGNDVVATEVRIGQEQPPWYCSEWGIYVDFEFASVVPETYPLRPASDADTLSNMHLVSKGGSCL